MTDFVAALRRWYSFGSLVPGWKSGAGRLVVRLLASAADRSFRVSKQAADAGAVARRSDCEDDGAAGFTVELSRPSRM